MSHFGTVYWITGYPGAGKSTIGKLFNQQLRQRGRNTIYLDGDQLRWVYGDTHSYERQERLAHALRYARLCQVISQQGIDVVIATVSMFQECYDWNRKNLPNYQEIYIKVAVEVLHKRDQKGLYSRALRGLQDNVVGVNLQIDEPPSPTMVVNNNGDKTPQKIVEDIIDTLIC